MRAAKLAFPAAAVIVLIVAVGAWAHSQHQEGGPNGDTLDGHAHFDKQLGRGGCDTLLARDGSDEGWGGDSGCDSVRGMEGPADASIVCDDGAGNDVAAGGIGGSDSCFVSGLDVLDLNSCEFHHILSYHC